MSNADKKRNLSNTKFYNHPYLKPDKITKRDYQVNIANECFDANTLVVLPTALGKTIIAVINAVNHLITYNGSKILILAPTKPLVTQHYETFHEFLIDSPTLKMGLLIGGLKPLDRALMVNNCRIVFSTPQIIQNDLNLGSYDLKDFTLVIFDEAHKARFNYAYTFVAQEYMNMAKKPFILGLTASPGKDKEIINNLMQKLFIEKVCFRTEQDSDVKEYIFPIELFIERIRLPLVVIEIQELLKNASREIIDYFLDQDAIPVKDYYSKVDFLRLNQDLRVFELYGDNYSEYNYPDVPNLLTKNPLIRFSFVSMCISAIYLLHMEEMLTTQNPSLFVNYCAQLKERSEQGSHSAKRIINSKYYKQIIEPNLSLLSTTESPKIAKVVEILTDIFSQKPDAKIIIFTQFRDMSTILKNKLDVLGDLRIKSERFIGQFNKPEDKGLTQIEQQEIIKVFKQHGISVLIATSIAEEGLDIPNVDAVIFYEPVPSEIRLIQRRGRTGRHSEGKCYIICARDTLDETYLHVAFRKEEKMHETLLNEEELEIISTINRSDVKFEPDEHSDVKIYEFFNDLKERRRITLEKQEEMIQSINAMDTEQKRCKKMDSMGIKDITKDLGTLGLEKMKRREQNLIDAKEEKYKEAMERRKQKMKESIERQREKQKLKMAQRREERKSAE